MTAEWTDRHVRALLDGVGSFGWSALKRRCGNRSKAAITDKIRREFGGGGITRGTYSLNQAEQETGYAANQLRRAAAALNQRWSRTSKGGNYLISADQLDECTEWLKHDYWCVKLELYGCSRCGTDSRRCFSFGLCRSCFFHLRTFAEKLGLPFSVRGLRAIVSGLRANEESRFLDSLSARLERGKPLDKEELSTLSELV